jgi:hypothetical protein
MQSRCLPSRFSQRQGASSAKSNAKSNAALLGSVSVLENPTTAAGAAQAQRQPRNVIVEEQCVGCRLSLAASFVLRCLLELRLVEKKSPVARAQLLSCLQRR